MISVVTAGVSANPFVFLFIGRLRIFFLSQSNSQFHMNPNLLCLQAKELRTLFWTCFCASTQYLFIILSLSIVIIYIVFIVWNVVPNFIVMFTTFRTIPFTSSMPLPGDLSFFNSTLQVSRNWTNNSLRKVTVSNPRLYLLGHVSLRYQFMIFETYKLNVSVFFFY